MGLEPDSKWKIFKSAIFLLYKNVGEIFSKHSRHLGSSNAVDFLMKTDSKHHWQSTVSIVDLNSD